MSYEITVPALGESLVEATVGCWLKQPGDAVGMGDPLVELETEKVNMEIAAAVTGILESIVKAEGEIVGIGDVLGIITNASQAAPQPSISGTSTSASLPQSAPPTL
jgi:2-oxoglutarate dehydrogenase E2 component (dihydrolipoamide succinyltransferase)